MAAITPFSRPSMSQTAAVLASLLRRLESDERLDPTVAAVHSRVSTVAARLGGRGVLSGSALGHPAHPLLVSTPIGCFTSAIAADLAGQHDTARMLTGACRPLRPRSLRITSVLELRRNSKVTLALAEVALHKIRRR
jgi:hypothetical protein